MKRLCTDCLLLVCLFGWLFARADARPNVVLIMTDDQGFGDFSCHGNPVLRTPNMDRLAAGSIRLTDFHVAPVCTPTRGQLLSGLDAELVEDMGLAPVESIEDLVRLASRHESCIVLEDAQHVIAEVEGEAPDA